MPIKPQLLALALSLLPLQTTAAQTLPEAATPAVPAGLILQPKGPLAETPNNLGSERTNPDGDWNWSLRPHRVFGAQTDPILFRLPYGTASTGQLELERNGQKVFETRVAAGSRQVLVPPLALAPGVQQLRFRWTTASRTHRSESMPVISLGIEPPDHTYIVVDKYQFSLFWVQQGVLQKIYPIATGRPRTPTVPGLWLLGQKEIMRPPTTDWGARRLKIYREDQYQTHWSGYAIHGTNRPTSIGSEASHGCVRMFNDDVIALFNAVPLGTPVQIVEKLPLSETAYSSIEQLLAP